MGKNAGGGAGEPEQSQGLDAESMDAPGVGMGPGTLRATRERTASKAGGRNWFHQDGQCGAHLRKFGTLYPEYTARIMIKTLTQEEVKG